MRWSYLKYSSESQWKFNVYFLSIFRCGDLILTVNNCSLDNITHANAVALLKHTQGEVTLRVVSWPGTLVWPWPQMGMTLTPTSDDLGNYCDCHMWPHEVTQQATRKSPQSYKLVESGRIPSELWPLNFHGHWGHIHLHLPIWTWIKFMLIFNWSYFVYILTNLIAMVILLGVFWCYWHLKSAIWSSIGEHIRVHTHDNPFTVFLRLAAQTPNKCRHGLTKDNRVRSSL